MKTERCFAEAWQIYPTATLFVIVINNRATMIAKRRRRRRRASYIPRKQTGLLSFDNCLGRRQHARLPQFHHMTLRQVSKLLLTRMKREKIPVGDEFSDRETFAFVDFVRLFCLLGGDDVDTSERVYDFKISHWNADCHFQVGKPDDLLTMRNIGFVSSR